jgi:hypothetical protein
MTSRGLATVTEVTGEGGEREIERVVSSLHERRGQDLYGLAIGLGLSHEDASDAVQEGLLRLWRELLAGVDIRDLDAWAFRTTYRLAIDQHRLRRRVAGLLPRLTGPRNLVSDGLRATDPAEIYDPETGRFTSTGNLVTVRYGHAAVLLADGRVLLVGGFDATGKPLADAEIFDPATGTFSRTGSLTVARGNAMAVALKTGKVLVVGGRGGSDHGVALDSAELYDPATGKFSLTGEMSVARRDACAASLDDGEVLVAGGDSSDVFVPLPAEVNSAPTLSSAEVFDPSSGRFHAVGSMAFDRAGATCTLLLDGTVLVAGGQGASGLLGTAELYDPKREEFRTTAGTMGAGQGLLAVRLEDGGCSSPAARCSHTTPTSTSLARAPSAPGRIRTTNAAAAR